MIVRYDARRRRVYVLRARIHHGLAGCALMVIGALLTLHDRRDYRAWFHDLFHPVTNPEGT